MRVRVRVRIFSPRHLCRHRQLLDQKRLKLRSIIASRTTLGIPMKLRLAAREAFTGELNGNAGINIPTITSDSGGADNSRNTHYDMYENLRQYRYRGIAPPRSRHCLFLNAISGRENKKFHPRPMNYVLLKLAEENG